MFQVDVPVLATAEFGRGNYVSIKIFKRQSDQNRCKRYSFEVLIDQAACTEGK